VKCEAEEKLQSILAGHKAKVPHVVYLSIVIEVAENSMLICYIPSLNLMCLCVDIYGGRGVKSSRSHFLASALSLCGLIDKPGFDY